MRRGSSSVRPCSGHHRAADVEPRHVIRPALCHFNRDVATDMQCINALELMGPSTPGELARFTGLTTGGVTVMLDRLEKGGYLKREPNPRDRRSVLVRLNPTKVKKMQAFYEEINERMAALLDETPDRELRSVVKLLSKMKDSRVEEPPRDRRQE